MIYTDPSGYFVKRLLKELSRGSQRYGQTIAIAGIAWGIGVAGVGLSTYAAGTLPISTGFAATSTIFEVSAMGMFATGFALGAISGADHEGVLAAGFTGLTMGYVGTMSGLDGISSVLLKGAVGGVSSAMDGGNFFVGFMGSVATAGLAPAVDELGSAGGFIVSAAIGGTISEAGGGKFANGAITASFNYMLSELEYGADEAAVVDEEVPTTATMVDASFVGDGLQAGDQVAGIGNVFRGAGMACMAFKKECAKAIGKVVGKKEASKPITKSSRKRVKRLIKKLSQRKRGQIYF